MIQSLELLEHTFIFISVFSAMSWNHNQQKRSVEMEIRWATGIRCGAAYRLRFPFCQT